jgi:hypothetical protein
MNIRRTNIIKGKRRNINHMFHRTFDNITTYLENNLSAIKNLFKYQR